MMTRSKSRKEAAIKYLFALPVILLLFIIFSRKQAIANIDEPVTEFEVILDKNEVDELPLFVGCEDISDKAERRECSNKKLLTYIYTSIKYPKEARLAGIQGKVYIKYVVGKNGMIKDARVVKSIGGGCDEAALKVVNSIPKMIPGTKDGKAVDVEMTLPVMFKLEGDDVPAPKKEETVETPKNKLEDITVVGFSPQKKSAEEEIFKIVEEMPRFPGCEEITNNKDKRQTCADENLMKFIYGNIRYPKAAREKGIQGKAYAQFVIQKDGTVTDVKIVKDQQGQFGDEVLRVVSMMPKWIPGKQRGKVVAVRYTLPVMFKLEGEAKKEKTTPNKNNPLIVIDGEIFKGENVSLEKINPEQIETIYVLKGEKAIEKYGDQGKDGVIEITMKEGADFNSLSEESKESIDLEKEEKNVGKQKEEKRHTKKDLGIESLKISPNPTSGIINIEFEADELLMEVIVYDMYGQELYRTKTYGGHRTLPDIDVSKAPKGNVLVAFKKGKKVYTEIIVVQ